jgi:hypothetical protein
MVRAMSMPSTAGPVHSKNLVFPVFSVAHQHADTGTRVRM